LCSYARRGSRQQGAAPGVPAAIARRQCPIGVDRQVLVSIVEFDDPEIAPADELIGNLARTSGLVTAVGLQARVNPAVMHVKELIEAGFVGEVMAVHVSLLRGGVLSRPPHRTWQRDAELGAHTLTIATGHKVDAMRFVTGDFRRLSAMVATQARQWLDTGTNTLLDATSPDNVLLSGQLLNGAVVSVHIAAIPFAGSGCRMEIYGRDGTLVATGKDSPQLSEVSLHGAKGANTLAAIPVPQRFTVAAPGTPSGEAIKVGQMYTLFARAIRGGGNHQPSFETAVELHRWSMPSSTRLIPVAR
jgi:predicted dehydrogenase